MASKKKDPLANIAELNRTIAQQPQPIPTTPPVLVGPPWEYDSRQLPTARTTRTPYVVNTGTLTTSSGTSSDQSTGITVSSEGLLTTASFVCGFSGTLNDPSFFSLKIYRGSTLIYELASGCSDTQICQPVIDRPLIVLQPGDEIKFGRDCNITGGNFRLRAALTIQPFR